MIVQTLPDGVLDGLLAAHKQLKAKPTQTHRVRFSAAQKAAQAALLALSPDTRAELVQDLAAERLRRRQVLAAFEADRQVHFLNA